MKNIHLIKTDKASRLAYYQESTSYNKPILQLVSTTSSDYKYQNLYITCDEEIKFNEPYLGEDNNIYYLVTTVNFNGKKIILTTDQDLIKDGVQAISDEFLEWFVKNPSCEIVKVRKIEDELISPKNPKIRFNALQDPPSFISAESLNNMILTYKYKIIVPKEEPVDWSELENSRLDKPFKLIEETKQDRTCTNNCSIVCGECQILKSKQETLEEAAYRLSAEKFEPKHIAFMLGVIEGAKWQKERMYSEEEVWSIINMVIGLRDSNKSYSEINNYFEQFKKK